MGGVTHLVSLRQLAGVETQFAEFVRHAARDCPRWTHAWLDPAGAMHPALAPLIEGRLTRSDRAKYLGRIKLPSRPRCLRAQNARRAARRSGSNVGVVWNRAARSAFFLDAMGAENVIHWEHGRAWHDGHERDRRDYFRRIPLVIANSKATQRVLELRWGYRGEVRVCLNALRPSLMPDAPVTKRFPERRAIRLGAAARLIPVKGVPLILHAFAALRREGLDVELHVAGDGSDRQQLESLAGGLGLGEAIRFHGSIANMAGFYADIDCLLHVPLTEAFGLVGIEAAAYGCPVIAANVDGLSEAVAEGVSGYCLEPTLSISEYASLGSTSDDVPAQVYDPVTDRLRPPSLVDPSVLARAVQRLFASAAIYEAMSHSASQRVVSDFGFEDHVIESIGVISAFAAKDRS